MRKACVEAGNGETQYSSFKSVQDGSPNNVGRIAQNSDRTLSVMLLASARHCEHRSSVAFIPLDFQESKIPRLSHSSIAHTGRSLIVSHLLALHLLRPEHSFDGRNGGQAAFMLHLLMYFRILS